MKHIATPGPLRVVLFGVLLATGPAAGEPAARLKDTMTAAEFERCGLQNLTPGELAALEQWIDARTASARATAVPVRAGQLESRPVRSGEMVSFNRSNGKYHCSSCQWAQRCTRNCVSVPLAEAKARGVPCKVCGGSCG